MQQDKKKAVVDIKEVQLKNLLSLAELVKRILSTEDEGTKRNAKISNPLTDQASKYLKTLSGGNCKIEHHHALYRELYDRYKRKILKSFDNPSWMISEETPIDIHIGVGTSAEKHNIILKLSVACNKCVKFRKTIDSKKYDNINDREEAQGTFRYEFLYLFQYRFLIVISDCCPEEDRPQILALIKKFRSKVTLPSDGDEEKGPSKKPHPSVKEKEDNFTNVISNLSGGGVDGKQVVNAFESFTSNKGLVDEVQQAINSVKDDTAKGDGMGDSLVKVLGRMAPTLGKIVDSTIAKKPEADKESSGDDSGDDSTAEEKSSPSEQEDS